MSAVNPNVLHAFAFFGCAMACIIFVGGLLHLGTFLSPAAKVDEDTILSHLKVGAFFYTGNIYGEDGSGYPGELEFPTLYLTIHIDHQESIRMKFSGHLWERIDHESKLGQCVLHAYQTKVWG